MSFPSSHPFALLLRLVLQLQFYLHCSGHLQNVTFAIPHICASSVQLSDFTLHSLFETCHRSLNPQVP
eukprot:scaffold1319_cov139-Skeletonema_menzelii.AAC.6